MHLFGIFGLFLSFNSLLLLFFNRRPMSEIYDGPQATRYALDEKFIQELEAEEITKPELKLKAYNWNTDLEEMNLRKNILVPTQYAIINYYNIYIYIIIYTYTYIFSNINLHIFSRSMSDNMMSSKPCVNVSPSYSTATITKTPKTPPAPQIDAIQQLIIQVTSQNIEISKTALVNLDKMLLRPDVYKLFFKF